MSIPDNSALVEGFISLLEGANDAIDSALLKDTQFHRGMNLSLRRGLVRTRPGWTKLCDLQTGNYNGSFAYRLNSVDRIISVIHGRLYATVLDTLTEESHGVHFNTGSRCYFVKAEKFCVIQDGVNQAVILNGGALYTDAITWPADYTGDTTGTYASRFPIGTIMAYGHGRIFLVPKYVPDANGVPTVEDGRPYFIASDITKAYRPQDCLRWTENIYLDEGGAFGMPSEFGFINGMIFFRNAQTAQDLGPLLVFARDGVAAFQINVNRSQWNEIDLSQVIFSSSGTLSPDSLIPLNDDIIYRGGTSDGIRTVRYTSTAVASKSGSLSNVPISTEVSYLTDQDLAADLNLVSSAFVNNRLTITSGGRDADGAFRSLIILDTNVASQITAQQAIPAYAGSWTGLRFLKVMKARYEGNDVLLAVVKRGDNANELWMLDEDAVDDDGQPIMARIYTATRFFGDPKSKKRFRWVDLWLKDIVGDVEVTCYYRPDGYPLWTKTNSQTIKADSSGLPQRRYRLRLSVETDASDSATYANTDVGHGFQFCLQWEGAMTVQECVFVAHREPTEDEPIGTDEETRTLENDGTQYVLDDLSDYVVT